MSLLELKGLKISYGGINAVKGIDLNVSQGEMVALNRRQRRRQDHYTQGYLRDSSCLPPARSSIAAMM